MPTVSSYLLQGSVRLAMGVHPERAKPDAGLLLAHLLRCNRTWLMANRSVEIGYENWGAYAALLERRYRGEPIQYIVGETEFYGLPFRVTPDVLIPRPETEQLVEKAIELAAGLDEPRIVDIGCGSGAIAVAIAHEFPNARMTATDISMGALLTAKVNAERNGVADRMRFRRGDLLAPVEGEQFDIVVSNPPYVPEGDRASLAAEVREYEPALALFAGADGLDVIRRLIPAAFAALVPGGWLVMELGYGQRPAVSALLGDAGFVQIEFLPDLQAIPRVGVGRKV